MAEEAPGAVIGRNIRAMREGGMYTRGELAEKAGVSAQGIAHLELGMSERPRRTTLEKIARGLGVDVETLLEGTGGAEAPKSGPSTRTMLPKFDPAERVRLGDVVSDQRLAEVPAELQRLYEAREAREITREDYEVEMLALLNSMFAAGKRAAQEAS